MGMIDYIRCEWPLDVPEEARNDFQTKSLDCTGDDYMITRRGTLHRLNGFVTSPDSKPEESIYGFTGILNILTNHDWDGKHYEFDLKFSGGKLVRVLRPHASQEPRTDTNDG